MADILYLMVRLDERQSSIFDLESSMQSSFAALN